MRALEAMRGWGGGGVEERKRLQLTYCLFRLPRLPAFGSFLIMRQSLPDTTLSLVEMFLEALERDMEGKFEQIFEGNRSARFARAQFPPLPSPF